MYHLINRFAKQIVSGISRDHVTEYDWLLQNVKMADSLDYQRRYKSYWSMNPARLSPRFYEVYFNYLMNGSNLNLNGIMRPLYEASSRADGEKKSLQFSFATKLLHVLNPRLPIFSSEVATFYFYQGLAPNKHVTARIDDCVGFYSFLIKEYGRIIESESLRNTIEEFRHCLQPSEHFSDEKVIDSLIWASVQALKKGALTTGQIVYS